MGCCTSTYSEPKDIKSKLFPAFYDGLPSMEGKVCVVTGCTTGTGLACAVALARKGATVALLNRPSARADAAFEKVTQAAPRSMVLNVPCDLMSFASVRDAATKLLAHFGEGGIDVLCNNAGIMAAKDEATSDGYDTQMQTNHLSHFLLTRQLWPALTLAAKAKGEARVVNHSSISAKSVKKLEAKFLGKNGGKLGGDAVGTMPFSGPRWERYGQTKLANLAFTYALRDRCEAAGTKVLALVAHPGVAATNLQVTSTADGAMSGRTSNMVVSQSAEDGAMGILMCCCAPGLQSGEFYGPKGMGFAGKAELLPVEARANEEARGVPWAESEKAIGEEFKV